MASKLEQLIELKEKYISMMKNDGKEIITQWLIQLSEFIPDLECFTWTQYTPYFNDGDACVFGVGGIYYYTFGMRDEWKSSKNEAYKANMTIEDLVCEGDGELLSSWSEDSPFYNQKELLFLFENNEELFEYVFGDGVRVVAVPIRENDIVTGFEYEVSDYEHD